MKPIAGIVLSTARLIATSVTASPYDNLSFALRQQQILNDLRSHCRIDKDVLTVPTPSAGKYAHLHLKIRLK